jgi:SHS2 domain-containing protein
VPVPGILPSGAGVAIGGTVGVRPVYTEVEHTADVGIQLSAPSLRSAFESAAAAMFDMICPLDTVRGDVVRTVAVEAHAGDVENLLVRWLSELLYLHHGERLLLSEFAVRELDGGRLEARVAGEAYDPERHRVGIEIKAPTYHDLLIARAGGHWDVRVIFDT